jgi:hypothetical protein
VAGSKVPDLLECPRPLTTGLEKLDQSSVGEGDLGRRGQAARDVVVAAVGTAVRCVADEERVVVVVEPVYLDLSWC